MESRGRQPLFGGQHNPKPAIGHGVAVDFLVDLPDTLLDTLSDTFTQSP
jgi:hypothetical protein